MSTVTEIVAAAARLDHNEFLRLRQELDRLERELWDNELVRVADELERAGMIDNDIDRVVLERRKVIRTFREKGRVI
jgi:hypothetical protein